MNLSPQLHASIVSFSGYQDYNENYEDNKNSGLQITTAYDQDFTEQKPETSEHQNPPNPVFLLNDQVRWMSTSDALMPHRLEPYELNPDDLCRYENYTNLRDLLRAC